MAAAARGQGERVQRTLVRSQSSGTIARQARARMIVFMQQAAHIVPVALIQFTDFASDVMVIVQLAMDGATIDWILCAIAVGISIPTAWLNLYMAHTRHWLNRRKTLMGCLLACGNLHVLYVGMLYVSATHSGAEERAGKFLWLFNQLKMAETAIESIVLGLVTAGAFFRTLNDGGRGFALFASSLALSLLSMAYGFFAIAVRPYQDSDPFTIRRKASIGRRRPTLFLCLLVHLCWGLAAFGCLAAAAGPWWWLGLAPMAAIGLVRGFLEGYVQSQPKTRANTAQTSGLCCSSTTTFFTSSSYPTPKRSLSLPPAAPCFSARPPPPSRSTPAQPSPPCSAPSSSRTSSARRMPSASLASSRGIRSAPC